MTVGKDRHCPFCRLWMFDEGVRLPYVVVDGQYN
jgi:hypothetical protein